MKPLPNLLSITILSTTLNQLLFFQFLQIIALFFSQAKTVILGVNGKAFALAKQSSKV